MNVRYWQDDNGLVEGVFTDDLGRRGSLATAHE